MLTNGRDHQWGYFYEGSYRFDVTETQSMGFFVRRENWDDKAGTKTATTNKNNTTRNSVGVNWWLQKQLC